MCGSPARGLGTIYLSSMSPDPPDEAGQVHDVALQVLPAGGGQLVPGHRGRSRKVLLIAR